MKKKKKKKKKRKYEEKGAAVPGGGVIGALVGLLQGQTTALRNKVIWDNLDSKRC